MRHALLGLFTALIGGGIAGALCAAAHVAGVFAQIWVAVLTGAVIGDLILRSVQRKRGWKVGAIAVAGTGCGAAIGVLLQLASIVGPQDLALLPTLAIHSITSWAAVGIIALCAWSRTRL